MWYLREWLKHKEGRVDGWVQYNSKNLYNIWVGTFNPFPNENNLDSSKLKEFADDKFKFDKNGRKLSKWVENTAGKGEIARYEQFLLFPQCFQETCTADT